MTHNAACRLPKKPSALIRLAIEDLKKAEKSKLYTIDMGRYHSGAEYNPGTCSLPPCIICMAGAVIAFSLGAPPTKSLTPSDFSEEVDTALEAINHLRAGSIGYALEELGTPKTKIAKAYKAFGFPKNAEFWEAEIDTVTDYADDSRKFKKEMLAMADTLESVGL